VLGGGSIGLELAQAFRRLGSRVTVVEMEERLVVGDEPEAGEIARRVLAEERVELRLGATARAVRSEGGEVVLSRGRPGWSDGWTGGSRGRVSSSSAAM
jgi:pyruvate/2-oxoglutarate dehydrogenase complex dihydrolipoamide dehydrogenase (E3) component